MVEVVEAEAALNGGHLSGEERLDWPGTCCLPGCWPLAREDPAEPLRLLQPRPRPRPETTATGEGSSTSLREATVEEKLDFMP